MKNFKTSAGVLLLLPVFSSCMGLSSDTPAHQAPAPSAPAISVSVQGVARMFAELPIEKSHLWEVHDAVKASSSQGYDEEYTLHDLLESPGRGVGGVQTRTVVSDVYMRELIADYLSTHSAFLTKAGASDVQAALDAIAASGYQIYWPYSEDWDGETFPVITFDPGFNATVNWGYILSRDEQGLSVVDSLVVDEEYARQHPVWVINSNDDEGFTPLDFFLSSTDAPQTKASTGRKLLMKQFTMLRNYDTWFRGGSEFFVKCGSINGFTASTEAELKLYQPSVTDFMVVVPRNRVGVAQNYDAIILTDFTNQMENLAFLISEDDGGTITSWKCSATVKIKSKSYGFEVEIPYNDKDDIVWRGQLSAGFFQSEDEVTGRFGDVVITFALE